MAQLDSLSAEVLRDATGAPYLSAKAYYWSDVGASSPLTTYSDAGLSSANAHPVVADGTTGAFGPIYLQAKRYWRTVTTSAGVSLTQFNLGPIDGYVTLVESASAPSPTYKLMYWYDTTTGNLKRRNAANSAWLDLGGIDSLLNAASVTEQRTGTATDKASTPDSVAALWQRGTDIAAGTTLSLPSTGGGTFNLTGTATTINGISSAQGGAEAEFRMNAAHTLTHNGTSFILPGAANITAASGDVFRFRNEAAADASGSNWRCTNIERASGSPINVTDQIASQATMEAATSTTTAVPPGRVQYHPGVCKGWVNFTVAAATTASHNVTSITDTGVAKWAIVWATDFSSASYCCVTGSEATANNETAVDTLSAGGVNVKMYRSDDTNTAETNSTASHVAAFGDQ